MIRPRSIRFRLVAWYSTLIICVALAFGMAIYRDIEVHLLNTLELTLRTRADDLVRNILPNSSADDVTALGERINRAYSPAATGRFIRITADNGAVIYRSPQPEDNLFDPQNVPVPTLLGARTEAINGHGLFIVAVEGMLRGRAVRVEMGDLMSEIEITLIDLRRSLILSLPLIALIASVGGYILVRRALKPVESISATAEEISFGHLDRRLPVAQTDDEIEHLSVRLNQMLDRLSKAYHQAREFSADASHELRTPLAIIRAELESLLAQTKEIPPGTTKRLRSILEEVEHVSLITGRLFALSRLEAGEAKVREDLLNLTTLVRGTVEQIALLAESKGIRLSVQSEKSVMVLGDSARLRQMLVALLDNAIKYTHRGGAITLTVRPVGNRAELTVSDTGIGIATADLPDVFRRFWRADKARSRRIEGAGLGLPIAQSICRAHGGSIEVTSTEGVGTSCHVRLPLAAQQAASLDSDPRE